MINVSGYKQ